MEQRERLAEEMFVADYMEFSSNEQEVREQWKRKDIRYSPVKNDYLRRADVVIKFLAQEE